MLVRLRGRGRPQEVGLATLKDGKLIETGLFYTGNCPGCVRAIAAVVGPPPEVKPKEIPPEVEIKEEVDAP